MIPISQYIVEGTFKIPGASDIKKMKDYYKKASDPERLIATIKDNDKLVKRYGAAIVIGWDDAERAFRDAILDKDLMTSDELDDYATQCKSMDVDTSDEEKRDKKDDSLAHSWISRSVWQYFNSLKSKGIEVTWKETFKNAKTTEGREAMHRNGRAWTEGFVVNLKGPRGDKDFTFDIITNEGGGLYGYSTGWNTLNLKQFKDEVDRILKNIL